MKLDDKEFLSTVTAVVRRVRNGRGAAAYAGMNVIMTEAKIRAPFDEGTLMRSGYVSLPLDGGDESEVEGGFGGEAEDYAVVQHEELSYHHDRGEAKYLENAIAAKQNEALEVARRVLKESIAEGRSPRKKVHSERPE